MSDRQSPRLKIRLLRDKGLRWFAISQQTGIPAARLQAILEGADATEDEKERLA